MEALKIIGWFIWLLFSIALIFEFVGYCGLTRMFPEGNRAWHKPVQLASLGLFAWAVLLHPF